MSATAADYSWWRHRRPDWAEAHCVTLVSDVTAEGVLTALGATGTGVVSGFDAFYEREIEGWVYRFLWLRDGQLLLDFAPLSPADRFGGEPDALLDDIREVGLPLDDREDEISEIDYSAAAFARSERITGIQCTPALFERSDFIVATVELPSGEEQERYGEALRRTWRIPAVW